eukprot:4615760-Lingulodinium_polyedra.AAC.1
MPGLFRPEPGGGRRPLGGAARRRGKQCHPPRRRRRRGLSCPGVRSPGRVGLQRQASPEGGAGCATAHASG